MNIYIDACCLGRRKTGNETYIRCLLQAFNGPAADGLNLSAITTPRSQPERDPAHRWLEIPEANFATRNFVAIPSLLAGLRRTEGPGLYHATYWTRFWSMPMPVVLMVHDLSFVSFPAGFKTHERLVYSNLVRACARQARHVLTVSEFSKRELMEHWGLPSDRISVTYEAADPAFQPGSGNGSIAPREAPYVLYVGNLHPRKNLVRLLQAFVHLRLALKQQIRLKVVGQKAWLYGDIFEAVRQHRLEADVDFTGYVSQQELVRFYREAAVTVYPSLYEGFGFPVLEAMSCGSPVVASNTTSIPEVAGGAALLVDPTNAEAIATAVEKVLTDSALRVRLVRDGFAQASRFSWARCAEETGAAYRRATA